MVAVLVGDEYGVGAVERVGTGCHTPGSRTTVRPSASRTTHEWLQRVERMNARTRRDLPHDDRGAAPYSRTVEPLLPELPERRQPGVHLGQGCRVDRVEAAPPVGADRGEAALAQHLELHGHRPAARSELPRDRLGPRCRTASAPATPISSRWSPTSSASWTVPCRPGCSASRPGSRTRSPRSPTCRPRPGSRTSECRRCYKAGLHVSAIKVDPGLYQHTDPVHVGNDMRLLVSDMAGRASIEHSRAAAPRLRPRLGQGAADPRDGAGQGSARGDRAHLRGRRRVVRAAAGGDGLRPPAVVLRRRVVAGDHRDP